MSDSMLHESVFRQRTEMGPKVLNMKLSVDRDLNCGLQYVT